MSRTKELEQFRLLYEEYCLAIRPILDNFEDASTKSLHMRRGNMLTQSEYNYIDMHIAEAESILRGILDEKYYDLQNELDKKDDDLAEVQE